MIRRLASSCAVVVALLTGARADDITTKTGSIYSGTIVTDDKESVTIDSPHFGRLRILRSDISKVRRTPSTPAPAPETRTPPLPETRTPPAPDPKGVPEEGPPPAAADPAAPAPSADGEGATSEDRAERRRQSKIVRRTEPQRPAAAAGPATAPAAEPAEDKATVGGTQLALVERGTWVLVFQPPRPFSAAPGAIEIGHRIYARLDSAGVASARLSVPMAAGEVRTTVRLPDVQRHIVVKPGGTRVRLVEGVERGAWLRVRLDDDTTVEGALEGCDASNLSLSRLKPDGSGMRTPIDSTRVVEVSGLLRSSATRIALSEAALGEPLGITLWPDGREIVGNLRERDAKAVTLEAPDGSMVTVPLLGPIAAVARAPAKWRDVSMGITPQTSVRLRSSEDFADARVERDLVGVVAAITVHAVSLSSDDGALVFPFESITMLAPVESDAEAASAVPKAKSGKPCTLPVLPGAPADSTSSIPADCGVSAISNGRIVTHVFVNAPFDGEVFGIRLGDKATNAVETTDLRFDTTVTPRRGGDDRPKPVEMVSHSLVGVSVTLIVDPFGAVSAIELSVR